MANITNLGSQRALTYSATGATTLPNVVHHGTVIVMSAASGTPSLTIPESTDVDWPIGTQFFVVQSGAATSVTVAKTGSDTIAGTVATAAAGDTLIVTKTSATGWHSALAT